MLSSSSSPSTSQQALRMCKTRYARLLSGSERHSDPAVWYQWFPEVAHFCEGTPLILVGTKTDLRRDEQTRRMLGAQGQAPITPEQGASVAKDIGAKYVECSAKTGTGVQEVFNLALKESMRGRWGRIVKPRNNKRCVVI